MANKHLDKVVAKSWPKWGSAEWVNLRWGSSPPTAILREGASFPSTGGSWGRQRPGARCCLTYTVNRSISIANWVRCRPWAGPRRRPDRTRCVIDSNQDPITPPSTLDGLYGSPWHCTTILYYAILYYTKLHDDIRQYIILYCSPPSAVLRVLY